MPNRIIKDSIAKSETVSGLTDFQFRLWVHLITYVDDYGRGDARPAIIKGACFPFRDRMTNKDIEKGLADLAGAGCIGLYKVDGKSYLYFPNWEQHQRVRQKVSKCPSPEDCDEEMEVAATCGDLPQDAARIQNPESRIQNTNPELLTQRVGQSSRNFGLLIPGKRESRKQGQRLKKFLPLWPHCWPHWNTRNAPPSGRKTVASLSPMRRPGSTGNAGRISPWKRPRPVAASWIPMRSQPFGG